MEKAMNAGKLTAIFIGYDYVMGKRNKELQFCKHASFELG